MSNTIIYYKISQYIKTSFYEYLIKISNKRYSDLIALAFTANGRKETFNLLYEEKFNKIK